MRIVYEKNIIEKLNEAIDTAFTKGKEINHIELSRDEYHECINSMVDPLILGKDGFLSHCTYLNISSQEYCGIKILVK